MTQQISYETYSGGPAANYERYFVPAIGAPLATDLIELAELRPGERVLDVACGTGVVTRLRGTPRSRRSRRATRSSESFESTTPRRSGNPSTFERMRRTSGRPGRRRIEWRATDGESPRGMVRTLDSHLG